MQLSQRDLTLIMIARKGIITIEEGLILIQEYIFDRTGQRVAVSYDEAHRELFEKSVTVASNYYSGANI